MADKFVYLGSSGLTEKAATTTSTGVTDAGKIVALGSDGYLDISVMPVGIGADTRVAVASENLNAGDLVNLYNNSGTITARKADATGGIAKQADGFVISAVSSGQNATIYFDGTITGLSGLTPGAIYYLSTTAGGITTTIPTTTAYIAQSVGKALSATELTFEPGEPVIRA
jgi:hypothetical protein